MGASAGDQAPAEVTEALRRRSRPTHGVLLIDGQATIVYLTVCTKDRRPWLASADVQAALEEVWAKATKWLVGRYVLMPDHLHCSPGWPMTPSNWTTGCDTGSPNSASSTRGRSIAGRATTGT